MTLHDHGLVGVSHIGPWSSIPGTTVYIYIYCLLAFLVTGCGETRRDVAERDPMRDQECQVSRVDGALRHDSHLLVLHMRLHVLSRSFCGRSQRK